MSDLFQEWSDASQINECLIHLWISINDAFICEWVISTTHSFVNESYDRLIPLWVSRINESSFTNEWVVSHTSATFPLCRFRWFAKTTSLLLRLQHKMTIELTIQNSTYLCSSCITTSAVWAGYGYWDWLNHMSLLQKHSIFYRALLQKTPKILRILLVQ